MTNKSFPTTTFLTSAAKLSQLPEDAGAEVAFVGRSNAGKSSALNTITGVRGLARTSKTPGCTQLINLFTLDEQHRLVDLPGYGYAKVAIAVKNRWQQTLARYLEERQSLRGLILLMDIRHPLREFDQRMLEWATQRLLPVHVLLTKSDKLSRSAAAQTLQQVTATLRDSPMPITVQLFSSLNRQGLAEARALVLHWLAVE